MVSRARWLPILEAETGRRARDIVRTVAAELHGLARSAEAQSLDCSLAGGWAGIALFHAYLGAAGIDSSAASHAHDCLSRAARAAREEEIPPGLFAGWAGLGWTARKLEALGGELPTELLDLAREAKAKVLAAIEEDALGQDFDLVNGWVGLGLYLLDCLPDRDARRALGALITRIAERADQETGAWWTPPDLMAPFHRSITPGGQFNLGVAHGVPGLVWLLASARKHGIEAERCWDLLARIVPWLLAQRREGGGGSVVPAFVAPGFDPGWCRSAWCYGDPGIAAVLVCAAHTLSEHAWERSALEIARGAALRAAEETGVVDAGLCHGAAGLAHLFQRLYAESGEPVFREAALRWIDDVLERQQQGAGFAGFPAAYVDDDGRLREEATPGLLEGTTGIALALLAAISDVDPEWDRMFLLSMKEPEAS